MKTSRLVVALAILGFIPGLSYAEIARYQLTSAVESHEPVDDLTNDVVGQSGQMTTVLFFTHVKHLAGQVITHKWFFDGQEQASVDLSVNSNNWRTYSSKRMNDPLQGNWQVQVWLDNKQLLSHQFTFRVFHQR